MAKDDVDQLKSRIKGGIAIFILAILLLGSFYIVGVGQRAVIFNIFSGVKQSVYTEGLHFKIPLIESVTKFDTQIQKEQMEANAASKDLQDVKAVVALNYHLDRDKIFDLYRNIGRDYNDRIIYPAVQESVKAATAQFTAEELITKRPEVKAEIRAELEKRLEGRYISVDDFSIVNFEFSPEYTKAIEAKQVAEQQVKTEQNNLEKQKLIAQQSLAQKEVEAKALELQKMQVTPDLIELRRVEVQLKLAEAALVQANKWNGAYPTTFMTMGNNGVMPLLNVPMPGATK